MKSDCSVEEIANNIVNLAADNSSEVTKILTSGITRRDDCCTKKSSDVHRKLAELCARRNIGFIDNSNINSCHLNGSDLHLNSNGTKMLSRNFAKCLNKC